MKRTEEIIDFDFGFSFIDDEIEAVKETAVASEATVAELQERLNTLYNAVEPFLDNLCKSPEKSTIFWPDRIEKIQSYKSKLKSIVEGS